MMALGLSLAQLIPALTSTVSAASPLNIFVGYFDTHTVPFSSSQPNPWPDKDPSSFDGTPCPNYPNDTTCWDASALRLDNPGSADVTGVHPVVVIGTKTYDLWGSSLTVKAGGMLVLTETGGSKNSENFDGSDFPPNSYNGGNTASCVDSGAIPAVKITIAGVTTTYLDNGQVLNGGGVDSGHCLNGKFVSERMDESHPWAQIGASSPVAPSAPQSLAATAGSGSVSLTWTPPASNGGAAISGYNIYRGTSPGGEASTPVASNVTTTSLTDTGLANGTTYYYKVAAVNAAGTSAQSSEVSATPHAPSAGVYVGRVGSATASSGRTTTSVPVGGSGVAAGHTLVVSLLLSTTNSLSGAVTVTDTAGNSYIVARDTNDGSAGDRTVLLASVGVKTLAAGGSITLTYPSSAETHVSVDEFSGITGVDSSAGASGTTAAFSSGTATTTQATDVLVGVVGVESGKSPTWASGWTRLPVLSVSSDYLGTAYQIAAAAGSYAAAGTTSSQWMASIVTLKTS
ncbi:MAG: fibronectin type III domain-containing protein [Streptosporangiaceae bacterium]